MFVGKYEQDAYLAINIYGGKNVKFAKIMQNFKIIFYNYVKS